MPDSVDILRSSSSLAAGEALSELPHFRFAVGSFDSRLQLGAALEDLRRRGLAQDSFNRLALRHVFADQAGLAVQELAFPGNREPICCTVGPLAGCLVERLQSGARSLGEALGHWLVLRHAAHFQELVEKGRLLLWIRLTNADDERHACKSLLANSTDSVGVHDLVAH